MSYRPLAVFRVPDDVPRRYVTGQLPEDERAPGTVSYRLLRDGGDEVRAGTLEVDANGVVQLPVSEDDAPGEYALEVGVLLRSMFLLPLAPR